MKEKSPKKFLFKLKVSIKITRKQKPRAYFYLIIFCSFVVASQRTQNIFIIASENIILKQHAAQITVNTIEVISLKKLLAPSLNKHTQNTLVFFLLSLFYITSSLLHFKMPIYYTEIV